MKTAMTDPQLLKSTIKVCMFDQYGTVVDMQTGLVEAATPFLKAGQPQQLRHLVAPHAFREFDDRRLARQRAYALSRDRRARRRLRDGPCRHFPYAG
jgi:hypothetical protein